MTLNELFNFAKASKTLPKHLQNSIEDRLSLNIDSNLTKMRRGLQQALSAAGPPPSWFNKTRPPSLDLEGCTREEALAFFRCIHMTRYGATNENIRLSFTRDERIQGEQHVNVLKQLCNADPSNESRGLSTIKHLRDLDILQKQDIKDLDLLPHCCKFDGSSAYRGEKLPKRANEDIFNYLVEWDPTALKEMRYSDYAKFQRTLLQDVMSDTGYYPTDTVRLVLRAGLKHLPHELGLLLLETRGYASPLSYAFQEDTRFETKNAWPLIEECLDEVVLGQEGLKLQEPNPDTKLYPFMTAATDQSCNHVDLVYYLLRKDPSVVSHFDISGEEREKERTCGKRKTKKQKKEKSKKKYCWTHGSCAHTSAECNHPKNGHEKEATFKNRMNGSTKGCNQCGKRQRFES